MNVIDTTAAPGAIGIPCFILEDGAETMDLNAVLK